MVEKIGVFLMDDEEMMRELLRETCPQEYQVLGEAATCQEAREKIPGIADFPGVLVAVLDGTLPDGRGEEIAKEFKEAREDTFVVSFSGDATPQTWGDANFQKGGGSIFDLWKDLGKLIS